MITYIIYVYIQSVKKKICISLALCTKKFGETFFHNKSVCDGPSISAANCAAADSSRL
jgi:hypothetical protein